MTREKAKEIIEIIIKRYCTLDKGERQALAIAIKALEQEPLTPTKSGFQPKNKIPKEEITKYPPKGRSAQQRK